MTTARIYKPPTDEQLARFITVQQLGSLDQHGLAICVELVKRPIWRKLWLERHRQFQEQAWALADSLATERKTDA